ncbi:macro domain-containing protein [uncultured Pseudacidovorax sp.]|uniref:type II toxin-antitoxin system antitoxin DNA ADP-ribosyl glycohydrolase DarG n=1 Tax=uncultured Pseudacidovorax sp. TaxID=679313 RepID=UPI0025D80AFE|nr:macro domain-containing protein [uncultured Pseudacidovorax sp.]
MIHDARGDLLKADVEALVNTVNTEGVMGKGIALQFKNAYPDMFKAYADACSHNEVRLGKVGVYDVGQIGDGPRWIINFPTKGHWRAKSRLVDIEHGLDDLVSTIEKLGIKSIALPPLGCGNGGLSWSEVRPRIVAAMARVPHVRVELFGPEGAPPAASMVNRTAKPRLTKASAALLVLLDRYVSGLLTPFVSLLEAQKLMYFLREAGEPTLRRLNFTAHRYGPFAAELSHVFKRLDSHYLQGVGDNANDPKQPLELVHASIEEAYTAIAGSDALNHRIDRVKLLIDGFEDPYGMELLSTLHYVMVRDNEARDSMVRAIECVHAWSDRKRKTLKADHLATAWQRLKDLEWDFQSQSIEYAP